LECTFAVLLKFEGKRARTRKKRKWNGWREILHFYERKTDGRIPILKVPKQYQLVILSKTSLGSVVCNVMEGRIS
jgi:hypothetical protein